MSRELEPVWNNASFADNRLESSHKLILETLPNRLQPADENTRHQTSPYNPWAKAFANQESAPPKRASKQEELPRNQEQRQPQLQIHREPSPTTAKEFRKPALNPYFFEREASKPGKQENLILGNPNNLRKAWEKEQQETVTAGALGFLDWGGSLGSRVAAHKMLASSIPEIPPPNAGALTWAKNGYKRALQPYLEATLTQLSERGITPATSLSPEQWLKSLQQWRQANMLTAEQATLVNQLQKLENCVYKTLPAEMRNDPAVRQAAQELAFHQAQYDQALSLKEQEQLSATRIARRGRYQQLALQGGTYLANLSLDLGFFNKTPVSLRTTVSDLASPLLVYSKNLPGWGKFAAITGLHMLNRCIDSKEAQNTKPPF